MTILNYKTAKTETSPISDTAVLSDMRLRKFTVFNFNLTKFSLSLQDLINYGKKKLIVWTLPELGCALERYLSPVFPRTVSDREGTRSLL